MTRARLGALLAGGLLVGLGVASTSADEPPPVDRALLIVVPGISFEDALAVPEVAAIARAGGAGLLVAPSRLDPRNAFPSELPPGVEAGVIESESRAPGSEIGRAIRAEQNERLLVIVVARSAPAGASNDEVAPVVMAWGTPEALTSQEGTFGSLTSDSTRRDGVVAPEDVGATFREYLGATDGEAGASIRVLDGPAPFELHDRYLAQRRMYVPIGTAGALYVTLMGLVAIAAVWLGSSMAWRLRRVAGWGSLSVAALATGLLAAGHLPELSYATVVPFVALVTVFGTLAFAPLEERDVLLVPAGIGMAVLAFFAIEAVLGWTAALTPFVGGSELDGGRFYGLPNAFIGLLIGSSLWVAQRLRTNVGFALIAAVGLFAGLPFAGANLGGAVSLFAAAGLWLALRERERLGVWRGIGVVVGVTVLGTAVVLVGHAISPIETHVARFEEQVGLAGAFERFGDRLRVGLDLIARNPFALVPVIGLPVSIAAVLRPPGGLRAVLEREPAWRDAILVTLLAGVVAYVANDSGPAAAGFAFGLGLGGLLGVSLLSGARKIGEP